MPTKKDSQKDPATWTEAETRVMDDKGLDDDLRARADKFGVSYKMANGFDVPRSKLLAALWVVEGKGGDADLDTDTTVA